MSRRTRLTDQPLIDRDQRFLARSPQRPTADGVDPARQATGRRSLIGMTARLAAMSGM